MITDSNGNVKENTFYQPFGAVDGSTPSVENRVGYTGHEVDEEAGQIYFGARYYNPDIIMFTQPDTLLPNAYDPQQLNRYSYARNNPYKYTDPNGHTLQGFLQGMVQTVSGVLGVFAGGAILYTTGVTGLGAVIGATLMIDGAMAATTGITRMTGAAGNRDAEEDRIMKETLKPTESIVDLAYAAIEMGKSTDDSIMKDVVSQAIPFGGAIYSGVKKIGGGIAKNMGKFLFEAGGVPLANFGISQISPGGYFDSTTSVSFYPSSQESGEYAIVCKCGSCMTTTVSNGEKAKQEARQANWQSKIDYVNNKLKQIGSKKTVK